MIPARCRQRLFHDNASVEECLGAADANIFKKSAKGTWQAKKVTA
jgi:hypothetical protein